MKTITLLLSLLLSSISFAQVGIGTTTPDNSAALDVESTDKGLLPPRMTENERDAITSPAAGLIVWCTNCGSDGEVQVFNGTSWTNMIGGAAATVPIILQVGDNYQGGKIAYILQPSDPGYDPNVDHGIIVKTQTISDVRWQNFNVSVNTGAFATALGTGNTNTTTIVNSQGGGSYAAKLCQDLVHDGYSDWYLPSKDELNKIYLNKSNLGYFYNLSNFFWSSSEVNQSNAWGQAMSDGNQFNNLPKNFEIDVSPIRSF